MHFIAILIVGYAVILETTFAQTTPSDDTSSNQCCHVVHGRDGLPGVPGVHGRDGLKGDKGVRGDIGPKGDRGRPGKIGAKGDDGMTGQSGPRGPPGQNGSKGEKGTDGLFGMRGEKGELGLKGEKGEQGHMLTEVKTNRIAFSVAIYEMYIHNAATDVNLLYSHLYTNINSSFDEDTGIFTCPLSGHYFLSFNSGEHDSTYSIWTKFPNIALVKNGIEIVKTGSTKNIILSLEEGDEIQVKLMKGSGLRCSALDNCNFLGYLLFKN
ncbi:complement C1q and tumor necrosis factor-related protein 9B-like [Anneissia japonica]|uniref:complement C1q and tumor necrosis factor-related protein 9B-like n=1 Tax=Anneissia japonica TaxID=1529436 RepID=UPI001425610E|nr:complement C1q and tumor necrosis factor-related protein 9B-like [Anneissia japonica]